MDPIGLKESARMRLEQNYAGECADAQTSASGYSKESLMAAVHPVKVANREHTAA
jgi:hypothetical protein